MDNIFFGPFTHVPERVGAISFDVHFPSGSVSLTPPVEYVSNWQPDASGHWAPISARVFVHPAAMRISDVLKLEARTGLVTRVSKYNHLELVQTAKSPN